MSRCPHTRIHKGVSITILFVLIIMKSIFTHRYIIFLNYNGSRFFISVVMKTFVMYDYESILILIFKIKQNKLYELL